MFGVIGPARKGEVVERASSTFKPSTDAAAGRFKELELNRPACLLLNDDRTQADPAVADELADPDFDDVAPAELTVDRKVKHRAVAQPALSIQPEPDSPDLLRLQRGVWHQASAPHSTAADLWCPDHIRNVP
jgi:hypothetical protein